MDDVELPIGGLLVLLPATRPAKGYYQVVERRDRADLSQMSPTRKRSFHRRLGGLSGLRTPSSKPRFQKNPEFPYEDYERFDLDVMDDAECKAEFRFTKSEIPRLAEALDIPATFFFHQGSTAPGMEGLCLVLKRLTYPCCYSDLIPRFVFQWNHTILDPVSLERYAEAVYDKGAALDNCIGFIDGTVRPICRPGEFQRVVYNGHKRVHALKFQSFTLPNGMIANMYGPVGKS